MRKFIGILLVICLFPLSAAANPQDRIRVETARQSVVSFFVGDIQAKLDDHFCAGTLIQPTIVLTAWHCFRDKKPEAVRALAWDPSPKNPWTHVKRIIKYSVGFDVALIELERPLEGTHPASISTDVAGGDPIISIGSTDGQPHMAFWGHISQIFDDGVAAFYNDCGTDKIGTSPQQILVIDVVQWSGSSGGGIFNEEGQLVGVLVRGQDTTLVPGTCAKPGIRGAPLWAFAVGPKTLQAFLASSGDAPIPAQSIPSESRSGPRP